MPSSCLGGIPPPPPAAAAAAAAGCMSRGGGREGGRGKTIDTAHVSARTSRIATIQQRVFRSDFGGGEARSAATGIKARWRDRGRIKAARSEYRGGCIGDIRRSSGGICRIRREREAFRDVGQVECLLRVPALRAQFLGSSSVRLSPREPRAPRERW